MNIHKETDVMVVQTHEILMLDKKNELLQRVISSLFFGPIFLVTSLQYGLAFRITISLLFLLSIFEWYTLAFKKSIKKNHTLYFLGLIYILISFYSMYKIADPKFIIFPFWLFCVTVWSFDSFAYFIGKKLQGPKLCPAISPGKTWSGFIGGTVVASLTFLSLVLYVTNQTISLKLTSISIFIPLASQFGDLLESKIKRVLNVKDSGTLIPGHGGILDRFDGMLFTSLCLYIIFS